MHVSILIPVYNAEKHLPKCLESCINQSFLDFEIVAVNDGSTDRSAEILDRYAASDSRIRVLHQANGGPNAARKKALDTATGTWILFVDSDDFIPMDAVEKLVGKSKENDYDIVLGNATLVAGTTSTPLTNRLPDNLCPAELITALFNGSIMAGRVAKLIKSEIIRSIDLPPKLIVSEDTVMNILLFNKTQKIGTITDNTYNYIQHADSLTHRLYERSNNSIPMVCLWCLDYFQDKPYAKEKLFRIQLQRWILVWYATFLYNGVQPVLSPRLTALVNNDFLYDRKSTALLPRERRILLGLFRHNQAIGRLAVTLHRSVRKVLR